MSDYAGSKRTETLVNTEAFIWALEQIGEKRHYGPPPVGHLIAYRDKVWRVLDTIGSQILLQPDDSDTAELHDLEGDKQWWRILPEHHAVCSRCGEPMPCRHLRQMSQANAALKRARRLMAIPEGACWACEKPISARQKAVTFPGDNLRLPGGPPVMFHAGIQECRIDAIRYQDDEWVKAEPGREPFLTWWEPYAGKPNTPQRRLLAAAARGELHCYAQRVAVAQPGDDLADMMTNSDRYGVVHWQPYSFRHNDDRHIRALLEAGLLAEPAEAPTHTGVTRPYTLTDEGRATHHRYPDDPR